MPAAGHPPVPRGRGSASSSPTSARRTPPTTGRCGATSTSSSPTGGSSTTRAGSGSRCCRLVILTKRPFTSGANYRKIWNTERTRARSSPSPATRPRRSPRRLAERYGDRVIVDFAMRYGNPSTARSSGGCRRRAASGSCSSRSIRSIRRRRTATANDQAFRALMGLRWQPAVRTVPAYYDHPLYIEALAQSVEAAYAGLAGGPTCSSPATTGCRSATCAEGDPYHCQCHKTTRLLRERLGWPEDEIVVSFQSRFGPEEWLKPYTVEEVARPAQARASGTSR